MELTPEILSRLGQPFSPEELGFLPRNPSNGRALALAYIDARLVMRRLDEVVPAHWSFDYVMLNDRGTMVKGMLTVCGVTRCDAGEADKEDETLKSAVSDALKRCGVHFGVGRYLYDLPKVWAPYDPSKRCFTETPRLDQVAVQRALRMAGVTLLAPLPAASAPAPSEPHPRTQQAVRNAERPAPSPSGTERPKCADCGTVEMPERVVEFSKKQYGEPVCFDCQKTRKGGNGNAQRSGL